MESVSGWDWAVFGGVVGIMLAVDLFIHRGKHAQNHLRAIVWSAAVISIGLGFTGYVWWAFSSASGSTAAQEYLAAYLIEESLSLDNLFVFLIIFRMMGMNQSQQQVALAWGILGAIVFRGIFIFLGAEALERWSWVEFILVAALFYAAWKAFWTNPEHEGEKNVIVDWLRRHLPVSGPREDTKFVIRESGARKATPLLVAICAIELSDVMFAIDSIPAVFSITNNTYLIYSSNVFAILGLRSLYIVLAKTATGLRYLHYGLAIVLGLAGVKILLGHWDIHVPPLAAVGSIVVVIGTSIIVSLIARRRDRRHQEPQPQEAGKL